MAEQAAEEAGGVTGLLLLLTGLIELRLEIGDLLLCLIERVLLNEDGLGEDVERVGVAAEAALDEIFGVGVFLREPGLLDSVDEALNHVLFLRGHGAPMMAAR